MRTLLAGVMLVAVSAQAEACLIVGVTDGDTLTVRCEGEAQQKIRLAEIDAPEKKQPFGERSRQALASLCFQQQAKLTVQTKDRYGRLVARVQCQGKDAGTELVRSGLAWVYGKRPAAPPTQSPPSLLSA